MVLILEGRRSSIARYSHLKIKKWRTRFCGKFGRHGPPARMRIFRDSLSKPRLRNAVVRMRALQRDLWRSARILSRFEGRRVTAGRIVGQIGSGTSVGEVLAVYPYLEREDVLKPQHYFAAVQPFGSRPTTYL